MNKEKLTGYQIAKLEQAAAGIKDIQDPVERKEKQKKMQELMDTVLQKWDLPAESELHIEKPLAHILDYISGGLRTAISEPLVQASRLAQGKGVDWEGAGSNILNTIKGPFGEGAFPTKENLTRAGIEGDLGHFSDLGENPNNSESVNSTSDFSPLKSLVKSTLGRIAPSPGSPFDFTGKGALGLIGDIAADPVHLKAFMETAGRKGAGLTAKELATQFAEEAQKSPAFAEKMGNYAGRLAIDPMDTLGESLYRSRFKNADLAAAAKGAPKSVSDIMLESQGNGVTSGGIQREMQGILRENQANKAVFNDFPGVAPISMDSTEALAPISGEALSKRNSVMGATTAENEAAQHIKDEVIRTYNQRLANGIENPDKLGMGEVEAAAAHAQAEARGKGLYDQPGVLAVPSLADMSKAAPNTAAYRNAQGAIGKNLRELQYRNMDAELPGLGGATMLMNKENSALHAGLPYLDRKWTPAGASTRATNFSGAASSLGGPKVKTIWNMLIPQGTGGVLQAGGGQAMMSPLVREGIFPAIKSGLNNDVNDTKKAKWGNLLEYIREQQ